MASHCALDKQDDLSSGDKATSTKWATRNSNKVFIKILKENKMKGRAGHSGEYFWSCLSA